jgi:hypothetical protein
MVVSVPLLVYFHAIGRLSEMPQKAPGSLTVSEFERLWIEHEKIQPGEIAGITPYWIYRWILGALINDYITPIETEVIYGNVSTMASEVAMRHMRRTGHETRGMLWWHVTHASLSIWIQRHWSAQEIAAKYEATSA